VIWGCCVVFFASVLWNWQTSYMAINSLIITWSVFGRRSLDILYYSVNNLSDAEVIFITKNNKDFLFIYSIASGTLIYSRIISKVRCSSSEVETYYSFFILCSRFISACIYMHCYSIALKDITLYFTILSFDVFEFELIAWIPDRGWILIIIVPHW
jgi:hypothetical protein